MVVQRGPSRTLSAIQECFGIVTARIAELARDVGEGSRQFVVDLVGFWIFPEFEIRRDRKVAGNIVENA